MLITPVHLLTDSDMAGDSAVVQQLENTYGYSVQAVYTGAPNGTLSLQASDDYDPKTGIGTWTTIADSSNTITGDGSSMWNVTSSNYRFVKFLYSASGGSGTLNVYYYGRGF